MFENNEQYSIESRLGMYALKTNRDMRKDKVAMYRKKHAEQEIAGYR